MVEDVDGGDADCPYCAEREDDLDEDDVTDEVVAWTAAMRASLLRDELEASVAMPVVLWPGRAA